MSDEPKAESRTVDSVVGQWIPVSERIPSPSETVLFVAKNTVYFGHKESASPASLMWLDHVNRDRYGDFDDVWGVTHWMPLPALPNKPGQAQRPAGGNND